MPNSLQIINLARRYARNYVERRWPTLSAPEKAAKVRELSAQPKWRALARINLTRQLNQKAA